MTYILDVLVDGETLEEWYTLPGQDDVDNFIKHLEMSGLKIGYPTEDCSNESSTLQERTV